MLAAAALSILGALLSEPTRHSYHALRHGQSLANVEGIISSNPDVATRERGPKRGELVAGGGVEDDEQQRAQREPHRHRRADADDGRDGRRR